MLKVHLLLAEINLENSQLLNFKIITAEYQVCVLEQMKNDARLVEI